jgi:hypothetical protein
MEELAAGADSEHLCEQNERTASTTLEAGVALALAAAVLYRRCHQIGDQSHNPLGGGDGSGVASERVGCVGDGGGSGDEITVSAAHEAAYLLGRARLRAGSKVAAVTLHAVLARISKLVGDLRTVLPPKTFATIEAALAEIADSTLASDTRDTTAVFVMGPPTPHGLMVQRAAWEAARALSATTKGRRSVICSTLYRF